MKTVLLAIAMLVISANLIAQDSSLSKRLEGRISCLIARPDTSVRVRISCYASKRTSKPLVLVDGLPIDDLKTINPDLIDSITIIKNPQAIALYGSAAMNGVISIRMKYKQLAEVKVVSNSRIIRCRYYCGLSCKVSGVNISAGKVIPDKKIIKTPTVSVYPNPAAPGETVVVSMNNLTSGKYALLLLNLHGQVIGTKEIMHTKFEKETLQIDQRVAAGIYLVVVKDKFQKTLATSEILIR